MKYYALNKIMNMGNVSVKWQNQNTKISNYNHRCYLKSDI